VATEPVYEQIGTNYAATRREEPTVCAAVHDALGAAETVLNVGAGTGSYEPADRTVVAVETSPTKIRQPRPPAPLVVRATADRLPFAASTFDAAMALLTVHHWPDPAAGLHEMARVSRRQVVFFFEPLHTHRFWVLDYFPEGRNVPTERLAPGIDDLRAALDVREVRTLPVPLDCRDGFGAAYYGRPERYLDPAVQAGMSWLALQPADALREGTERLRADLASGAWDRRHGHLRTQPTYDGGYRLAIADG
jgi:SAM-dependent methyltransferase